MWLLKILNLCIGYELHYPHVPRDACTIPEGGTVLVTGGRFTKFRATRYSRTKGWVKDLPDLKVGRLEHGCAAFTVGDKKVACRSC